MKHKGLGVAGLEHQPHMALMISMPVFSHRTDRQHDVTSVV
jgi:hypothetical protein